MKKSFRILSIIVLIAVIVGVRMYRKYERQQRLDEQQRKQLEWVLEGQKKRKLEEQRKLDSIRLAKPTQLDSARIELEKGRKKLQETLRKLEEQKK